MTLKFSISLFALAILIPCLAVGEETTIKELPIRVESPTFVRQGAAWVTQADVDAFMESVPREDRAAFLASPDRIARMLNNILLAELFAATAIDQGFLDDSQIQASLYQTVVTEIAQMYRERYLSSIELEDYSSLARELYLSDDALFRKPPAADFRHILVTVGPGRDETEAMKEIVRLHEVIKDGGDFSELAKEFSDDPESVENGGLYTEIPMAELDRAIAATMSSMDEGAVSDPVRTSFGWHIVRVEKFHENERLSWEEAKDQALQAARNRHLTQALERKLRDLQDEPVSFAPGAVRALRARYFPNDSADETASEKEISEAIQKIDD